MVDIKVDLTLEYPVSIDSILSLSFNEGSFKVVFEFILDALRRHEGNFKALKDSPSKNDFEALQRALKEAKGQINELQHTTLGHENSIKTHSEDIQKQKTVIESTNKTLENLAKTLQKQEKTLESFQLEQSSIKYLSNIFIQSLI
ncbi:hypothetical protein SteCoe_32895 [Stentor coeruleus]|uniref:Uncharacterized protein n=1 Tax=Stentor coeruleus TaxID=5963 RepID=A0A1R2AY13_9CILI|nr:hypothetical protein SteCoe_32895 [Stentor coeruleus]